MGGKKIGKVGKTGAANGVCHCHFEVRYFRGSVWPGSRYFNWGTSEKPFYNIYGPGNRSEAAELKANWHDPEKLFGQFPNGIAFEQTLARSQNQPEVYWLQNEKAYHVLGSQKDGAISDRIIDEMADLPG